MNVDWGSLALVAATTLVAAIAIVGIFSLGVAALTAGSDGVTDGPVDGHADGQGGVRTRRPGARLAGYACIAVSGLLMLYGLYLIIPQFH